MFDWQSDKRWSDRFLPEIKQILGQYLIIEPPIEEDTERNTDLTVLRLDPVRVACRIRKYPYYLDYPNEFTVRECRPSGATTELAKIIQGWGDYLFYGFADQAEENLLAWRLIDLSEFRLWFTTSLAGLDKRVYPGIGKSNQNESSSFRVFNIDKIDPACLIARHDPKMAVSV